MRILIVDDNFENLYMLEALLRGHGHEVVAARNGLMALERLRAGKVDLIVSDILMPKMDGFQLCRAVRSDDELKGIPFVFYTATYTDAKDVEFGLSIGADRYLIKPQDTDLIIRVVGEVVAERGHVLSGGDRPLGDDMEFFRQYNEALFRKLEQKMTDLKRSHAELRKELIERQQTEHALRASRERFGLILNSAAEGIYGIDLSGNCMFCNASAVRMLGYDDERQLIGKNMHELVHHTREDGSPYAVAQCEAHRILATGGSVHSERDLLWRRDGTSFIAEYWAHPMRNGGAIRGAVVTFIDITGRLALETQLLQAQKMESVGQFAGGVAHDFNNILTAIIGYAAMALDAMAEDDANRHNVDQVLAAANRGTVLTQSLLAFGRKQVTNLAVINLNEVVLKFEKFLLRLLREDIDMKTVFAAGEIPVVADRGQVEQILMNLVTNARDAMPRGGRLVIETGISELDREFAAAHGLEGDGEYALLTVTDTGVGITEEVKRRIFEPFFTTKEEGQGSGLGLAMVLGIVKQHRGCIDVRSGPGIGTTFAIYLPLGRSATGAEDRISEPKPAPRRGTETILVAEDDATLRQLVGAVLRDHGYSVIEACDGEEAVARVSEDPQGIHLALLDGIMPRLNGRNAWKKIHAMNPRIKAIFISGHAENVFAAEGMRGEEIPFIQKPVPPSVLVRKIREVLDGP